MHEDLEKLLHSKHVVSSVHKGEQAMPTNITSNDQPKSFFRELLGTAIPASIAFSFTVFAMGALWGLTMQVKPELEIAIAMEQGPDKIVTHNSSRVLGTYRGPSLQAQILANNQPGSVRVTPGSSVDIAWSSTNADSCVVSPLGVTGTEGEGITDSLFATEKYTLTCKKGSKVVSDSVTVEVYRR